MAAIDIKTIMAAAQSTSANQSTDSTNNDSGFDPFSTLKSVPKPQIPNIPAETEMDPFKTLNSVSSPISRSKLNEEINITDSPTASSAAAPVVPYDSLATFVGMPAIKVDSPEAAKPNAPALPAAAPSTPLQKPVADTPRNVALMYIGVGIAIALLIMGLFMLLVRG
jgi:hypothetical protein